MKSKIVLLLTTLFFTAHLWAQIPTNGLVAYYPFNGNANDASGNGNNGIVNGATLTTDRLGNMNSAYTFNGLITTLKFPTHPLLVGLMIFQFLRGFLSPYIQIRQKVLLRNGIKYSR